MASKFSHLSKGAQAQCAPQKADSNQPGKKPVDSSEKAKTEPVCACVPSVMALSSGPRTAPVGHEQTAKGAIVQGASRSLQTSQPAVTNQGYGTGSVSSRKKAGAGIIIRTCCEISISIVSLSPPPPKPTYITPIHSVILPFNCFIQDHFSVLYNIIYICTYTYVHNSLSILLTSTDSGKICQPEKENLDCSGSEPVHLNSEAKTEHGPPNADHTVGVTAAPQHPRMVSVGRDKTERVPMANIQEAPRSLQPMRLLPSKESCRTLVDGACTRKYTLAAI